MFGKIGSMFNKIRTGFEEMKAERERADQEKAARRAKDEAEKFSSLGMAHGNYPSIYQEDLDVYISIQNNITSDDDYGKLKIINAVDTSNDRGYFQIAVPVCKIYWLESSYRDKKELMSLLFEVERFEAMDAAGGIMTFLYPAIHALYTKFLFSSRSSADETIAQIAQFISEKSVEQIQSLQAEIVNVGGNIRSDLYITVAKDAEYENILSHENVKQFAATFSNSNEVAGKDLGISRADFVKGCNAALLETAHALDKKPLNYYDRFILNDNAVEEFDAESGRIIYFKLGEKNIKLGCFKRENNLAAIFYSSEMELHGDRILNSDQILILSVLRSFYKGVDFKKISNHFQEMLAAAEELIHSQIEDMKRETRQVVISARTFERTSAKEFRFEGELFFVKVTTIYDNVTKFMKRVSSFTITRDAALENIFDQPSESVASNAGLGITRAEFLNNYGAFIDEYALDNANNPFKIVGERTDELGESYLQLNDGECRIYLTVGEQNLEQLTYRSLNLSGWKVMFHALSNGVIKGCLNAVEDFSKFVQETAEIIEKEMRDALAKFESEINANTPTKPIERKLFSKTFSISGLVFEFVLNVLVDPTRRKNPVIGGIELTIKKFS